MTFVASDPLSELVWSPQEGLSLKCADCSLAEKKPAVMWDVGPSNVVLSPTKSMTSKGTNNEEPTDERNLSTSQAAVCVKNEIDAKTSLARSPRSNDDIMSVVSSHQLHMVTSGSMEGRNAHVEVSLLHVNQKEENVRENEGKGLCLSNDIQKAYVAETGEHDTGQEKQGTIDLPLRISDLRPGMAQSEPLSGEFYKVMMTKLDGRIVDVASGSQALGLEVDSPMLNSTPEGTRFQELTSVFTKEGKNKMKTRGSVVGTTALEKLESTDENDCFPIGRDACSQSEECVPRNKSPPAESSPTNSRIHFHQRKGKEMALSEGDVKARTSKEEDDSHESVESCNSAGLFSTEKRKWNFEQELIVGSKRVKRQIQEIPASTSFGKQDSSFMNWISNMVKGLPKSIQDENTSLALTLASPYHGHETRHHEIMTCNKNHDPGSRNMGFQTIFQSMYRSNTKVEETGMFSDQNPIGVSKELVLTDKKSSGNINPVSCHGESDEFCKQFLLSGSGGGIAADRRILPANIAATQELSNPNSKQKMASCEMECGMAKDRDSSMASSLGQHETNSTDKPLSDLRSESKTIYSIECRNDPLGSSWITRFSAKNPGPPLNLEGSDQSTRRSLEYSADCNMLTPHANFSIDQKGSEAKKYPIGDMVDDLGEETQNYASTIGPSLKRIRGYEDSKSICKLNPIRSSPKIKSSGAMASLFARRLDALKHIIPADVNDDATRTIRTCFFCGLSGHDLRDCSEITETELVDLLRNMTSYDGVEESPCLCIRCFQHDHWAISCPMTSLSRQHQSEYDSSLIDNFNAEKVQLTTSNERCNGMLEAKRRPPQVAHLYTISGGKNPQVDTDFSVNPKRYGRTTLDRGHSNAKHVASSSGENELKEDRIVPLCNFINKQILHVPKGMFDAMRGLRLSRMDILKCMNSKASLSQLDGFFLRLRLVKRERGLEGRGYHVACITGAMTEKSPKNSDNSIPVNVGGIECLVESRYVSNHGFLEDELVAWWSATCKSGAKIPSEEDLKLKLEHRKRLGF